MTTKKPPRRRRCPRCGLLWPQFAGPCCNDCAHQLELPFVTAAMLATTGRRRRPRRSAC